MRTISIRSTVLVSMLLASFCTNAAATAEERWPELSLGDLMKIGVESASRKNQSVSSTAAVYVISATDIKRSGALSIPEALRLAPESSYNFTPDRHFDLCLRRVGGLSNSGFFSVLTGTTPISARNELDLRFAEQMDEALKLSLTLQNLLSKQQFQIYPDYMPSLPGRAATHDLSESAVAYPMNGQRPHQSGNT